MLGILELAVLLICAKAAGGLAERFNAPAALGYLLVGLISATYSLVSPNPEIVLFGQLGALLLVFTIGMRKTHISELFGKRHAALNAASLAFILSFAAVAMFLSDIGFSAIDTLMVAGVLSVPAVMYIFSQLMARSRLDAGLSRILLGMSMFGSILAIGLFALVVLFVSGVPLVFQVGAVCLTVAVFLAFHVAEQLLPSPEVKAGLLSSENVMTALVLAVLFSLAYLAQQVGLVGLAGAFFAGALISKTGAARGGFYDSIARMTDRIFVPVLFAWVGLMVVPIDPAFAFGAAALLTLGGFAGAFAASRIDGLEQSLVIGAAASVRGGMDAALIAAAASLGIFSPAALSCAVLAIVLSMAFSPILSRLAAGNAKTLKRAARTT